MHRAPAETVQLGEALELVTELDGRRTTWDEVRGWWLLTTPDAEWMDAGRARLIVVPGIIQNRSAPGRGAATYAAWHEREPEYTGELELPDVFGVCIGRALRLDYASDKWAERSELEEYTHDFTEGLPPLTYVDRAQRPRGFLLVGGDMRVTEDGIA